MSAARGVTQLIFSMLETFVYLRCRWYRLRTPLKEAVLGVSEEKNGGLIDSVASSVCFFQIEQWVGKFCIVQCILDTTVRGDDQRLPVARRNRLTTGRKNHEGGILRNPNRIFFGA